MQREASGGLLLGRQSDGLDQYWAGVLADYGLGCFELAVEGKGSRSYEGNWGLPWL